MFLYSKWTGLSLTTRNTIAQQFGISKTSPTHVQDNRIVSDGYKVDDVERALNVDAIQTYTGNNSSDMAVLWEALVAKAEGRLPMLETATLVAPTLTEVIIDSTVKPIKKVLRKKK